MLQLEEYWTVIKYWTVIIDEALPNELPCTRIHSKNAPVHFDLLKTGLICNKSWWANFDMMLVLPTRNPSKNKSSSRIPYFNQLLLFGRHVTVMSNYNFRSWHLIKGIRKYHYLSYIFKRIRLPWTEIFYIQGRK